MPEKNIDYRSKDLLFKTLAQMEQNSLTDLLTSLMSSSEIKDLSRRLMAAKLLKEEDTYQEIVDRMGMSEGTINKIHFKTKGSPIINKLFNND